MGYNIEISVNMLKETKFSEVENTIEDMAKFYSCDNIYSLTEEGWNKKNKKISLRLCNKFYGL